EQLPKLAKKMKRWGAGALLCNGMTCMQAALIAWITIRLWTHFLAYNPKLDVSSREELLSLVNGMK
ncbi:MAG: hypothetical protein SOY87_08560, partial [Eggerthella lenta]|nr:hypothetical protein [Eggerthella lenta]